MRWVARGLGAVAVAWLFAGCLGGGSGRLVGEACEDDGECRSGLLCAYGRCRSPCTFDRDCAEGEACVELEDGSASRACATVACGLELPSCPAGLVCAERLGQCREPCLGWAECGAGRFCVDGACVEPATDLDCGEDPPYGEATSCEETVAELGVELARRLEARTVPAVDRTGTTLAEPICPIEYENGEDSRLRAFDGGTALAWGLEWYEDLALWMGGRPTLLVFVDPNAADCEQPSDCTSWYSAGVLVRGVNARAGCPFAVDPALGPADLNLVDAGTPACWGALQGERLGSDDSEMPPQLVHSIEAIKEEILAVLGR